MVRRWGERDKRATEKDEMLETLKRVKVGKSLVLEGMTVKFLKFEDEIIIQSLLKLFRKCGS